MKKLISKWWFWLITSVVILTAIHIMYKVPAPCYWLECSFSAGELISFVGTVVLGFVAVYQTRQANEMSKKLLEKEIIASTPFIDLQTITEEELKKHSALQAFRCEAGECFLRIDNYFKTIESNGCDLFYKIKNVRDNDILSIAVLEIEIAICSDGKKINPQKYSVRYSHNRGTLSGREEAPFIASIPNEWFAKVAAYTFSGWAKDGVTNESNSLSVEFLFLLTNNDGCNYKERICIEIVNAKLDGIQSYVIVNKTLSKAEREE